MKVIVEGKDDFSKKGRGIVQNVRRTKARAIENALVPTVAAARNRAPVDTGALKKSIHSDIIGETADTVEGVLVADVYYAGYVEFGTRKMTARPYMRPAITETQANISKIIAGNFGAAINEH